METELKDGILGSYTNFDREQRLQYDRVHHWLIYHFGNAPFCIFDTSHQSQNFQWANVSGVYDKDLDNFLPMCRSCHAKFDVTDKMIANMRRVSTGNTQRRRSVSKLDDNGVVVATYPSLKRAAEEHKVSFKTIWQAINKDYKAGGFRWMYS